MSSDRRWNIARRCCAKHVSKSKCAKHLSFGARLEVEMSKKCTPLRREAHFQCSDHFWKLTCQKIARSCGAKHVPKSKCTKHTPCSYHFWEVEMSKKCTPLWREAHFQVNMLKTQKRTTCSDHFWTFRCRFAWQAQGILHLPKVSKTRSCSSSRTLAGVGHVNRICKDACRVAGAIITRDMFTRDVRRSGRKFPERGCILEHQICRFATMILRDRCSTSYDLGSLFCGRRGILDRRSGKIAKRIGTRPSPLLSTFHF